MRFPTCFSMFFIGVMFSGCQSGTQMTTDGSQFIGNVAPLSEGVEEIDYDGEVISLNDDPAFVVMEFKTDDLPAKDRLVALFREGEQVGLVRVTGPNAFPHVIGDLIEGTPQVGDGAVAVRESRPRLLNFGKVVSLNEESNFAVVEFVSGRFPSSGSGASVYRDGNKVGEIRISGPSGNFLITADIRDGEIQIGDEVRPN